MPVFSALARFWRRLCCCSRDGSELDPYAAEPTNRFTTRGPRGINSSGQSGSRRH
ncbi:hypothetical protein B0H12DRAFT_1320912 [Mycena haematopus]|nr:hypothetical protein B0H12DRAFT_1320912 [Mycena haematopus]